jgi:hypothetical protein
MIKKRFVAPDVIALIKYSAMACFFSADFSSRFYHATSVPAWNDGHRFVELKFPLKNQNQIIQPPQ